MTFEQMVQRMNNMEGGGGGDARHTVYARAGDVRDLVSSWKLIKTGVNQVGLRGRDGEIAKDIEWRVL